MLGSKVLTLLNSLFTNALSLLAMLLCQLTYAEDQYRLSILGSYVDAGDLTLEDSRRQINPTQGSGYTLIFNRLQRTIENNVALQYEGLLLESRLQLTIPNKNNDQGHFELTSRHLHIGGTYEWADNEIINPFVGGTIGVSHLTLDQGNSDSFWGFSVAGGVIFKISQPISLRLEARAVGVNIESNTQFFCSTSGQGCVINIQTSTWWHRQINAGISFHF